MDTIISLGSYNLMHIYRKGYLLLVSHLTFVFYIEQEKSLGRLFLVIICIAFVILSFI